MTPRGRVYRVTLDGRTYTMTLGRSDDGLVAELDGERVPVSSAGSRAGGRAVLLGSESWDIGTAPDGSLWSVPVRGRTYGVEVVDEALARLRRAATGAGVDGHDVIRAPMPGLVVAVPASPGERIEKGAPVVVLEAMKMQNELTTRIAGTVERVAVTVGDKVEKDALLAVIAP